MPTNGRASIDFFCDACGIIQPAREEANYFQLLGMCVFESDGGERGRTDERTRAEGRSLTSRRRRSRRR